MPLIFDIKRFALHDGPGIRTTVFFKGCPLRCAWCHNPESHLEREEEYVETNLIDGKEIRRTRVYGKRVLQDALVDEVMLDKQFYDESGGGVTISGGEPMMQADALIEFLRRIKKRGVHAAVDTTGYASAKKLREVAELTDLFLYDLKLMNPRKHKNHTGVDNRVILENADMLLENGNEVFFRIPLIPGINDVAEELDAFTQFLDQRKSMFTELHLLPYHALSDRKYQKLGLEYEIPQIKEPPMEHIEGIRARFESLGIKVIIGG